MKNNNKNMKKIIFLLMGIVWTLFLYPSILAAPPVTQIQQFTEGYIIKIPQDNVLKILSNYDFNFHIYNISNGYPKTSGISCIFHLYNSSGEHQLIMETKTPINNYDYSFEVAGTNFSNLGTYYYNIECNGTTLGGYASSTIEVTGSGEPIQEGISYVFAAIIITIFGIAAIFFYLTFKIEEPALKIFFWLAGFIFLIASIGFSMVIGYNSNYIKEINHILVVIIFTLGIITFLMFALTLVKQIVSTLDLMRERKGYDMD